MRDDVNEEGKGILSLSVDETLQIHRLLEITHGRNHSRWCPSLYGYFLPSTIRYVVALEDAFGIIQNLF